MSFLRNLFKNKQQETTIKGESSQTATAGRNPEIEELLRKNFGLEFRGNSWHFGGLVSQDAAPALSSAESCLALIEQMRAKVRFNQVCIVAGSPSMYFVCNTTPPVGVLTSLATIGTVELIALVVKASRKQVYEYHGMWLLTLD